MSSFAARCCSPIFIKIGGASPNFRFLIHIFHCFSFQASSAILLAARDFNVLLPMKPRPWWEIFLGNEDTKGNELVDVANAILGTCNLRVGAENGLKAEEVKVNTSDACIDWLVATKGFVRSRVKTKEEGGSSEKSFNDPDSFLWFYYNDLFEKTMQNQSA